MKKILYITMVSLLLGISGNTHAQQQVTQNEEMEQELINLSKTKWQWMAEFNIEALSNLFHDKAVFVHMGATFTKDQELDVINKKNIIYKYADIKEISVQVDESTAILLNRIRLESIVGGNEVVNPFVVTEIYIRKDDEWKLMAMSFTRQAYEYELNLNN